jgi:hypothetical protein
MIKKTIRKVLVVLIMILPVISYEGCKKQAKCGCGQDVISTLVNNSAYIYWTTSQDLRFTLVGDPTYSTYYFCNPSEMYQNLKDAKSGDILLVSGKAFYDCTYVYQASNSSYQSYQKVYQVEVSDLSLDLYGKGKPATGIPPDSKTPTK